MNRRRIIDSDDEGDDNKVSSSSSTAMSKTTTIIDISIDKENDDDNWLDCRDSLTISNKERLLLLLLLYQY